jgi:hypothetical protein
MQEVASACNSGRLSGCYFLCPFKQLIMKQMMRSRETEVEYFTFAWGPVVASQPVRISGVIRFGEDFEFDLHVNRLSRRGRVFKLERQTGEFRRKTGIDGRRTSLLGKSKKSGPVERTGPIN